MRECEYYGRVYVRKERKSLEEPEMLTITARPYDECKLGKKDRYKEEIL